MNLNLVKSGKSALVALSLAISSVAFADVAPVVSEMSSTSTASSYELKRVNITVSPLGFIIGSFGGGVDFGVSDRITLGAYGSYLSRNIADVYVQGGDVGARARFYLTGPRLSSGWYLSPSVGYTTVSIGAGRRSISVDGPEAKGIIGYQWVFDNGINIALGAGLTYRALTPKTVSQDGQQRKLISSLNGIGFASEVSLGFAF